MLGGSLHPSHPPTHPLHPNRTHPSTPPQPNTPTHPQVDWDTVDWDSAPAIQNMPITSLICEPKQGDVVDDDEVTGEPGGGVGRWVGGGLEGEEGRGGGVRGGGGGGARGGGGAPALKTCQEVTALSRRR